MNQFVRAFQIGRAMLLAALFSMCLAIESQGQSRTNVLLFSGQQAPGTAGASFALDFTTPGISNHPPIPIGISEAGKALIGAQLTGGDVIDGVNDTGLWVWENGELSLLSRAGDPVPGLPGFTIKSFRAFYGDAFIDLDGEIAFMAEITNGSGATYAFFWVENGIPELVMTDGTPVDGGYTISPFAPTSEAMIGGRAVIKVMITGSDDEDDPNYVPGGSNEAVLLYDRPSDTFTVVVIRGIQKPGAPADFVYSVTNTRALGNNGDLVLNIQAIKTGSPNQFVNGIYRWKMGALSTIEEGPIEESFSFSPINPLDVFARMNDQSDVLFQRTNTLDPLNTAPIYYEGQSGAPIVSMGDPAPDTEGETFSSIGNEPNRTWSGMGHFDNGGIFTTGKLSGGGQGIWISDDQGVLRSLAHTGLDAPGHDPGTVFRTQFDPYMMVSRTGRVAFRAEVKSPLENNPEYGIWIGGMNELQLLLRFRQEITVADGDVRKIFRVTNPAKRIAEVIALGSRTGTEGRPTRLNPQGKLLTYVAFADDPFVSTGHAILLVTPGGLTVNSVADLPDADDLDGNGIIDGGETSDGVCDTGIEISPFVPECTLRAAITETNTLEEETIKFNIPLAGKDDDPPIITPASPLPTITSPVNIDGTTQPGGWVIIDGFLVGASTNGFHVTSGETTLRGLAIINFSGNGILLETGDGNVVQGCFIGTVPPGGDVRGNQLNGIQISQSSDNRIGGVEDENRNTIAFNFRDGIQIVSGTGNILTANSTYGNLGLGINLDEDGDPETEDLATRNDHRDEDNGANDLQNAPQLVEVDTSTGEITVTYLVDSDPAFSVYPLDVEFFIADADFEEGQTYIDTDEYTIEDRAGCGEDSCEKSITLDLPAGVSVSDRIVASARDAWGNTSEFSGGRLNVNSTDDLVDLDPGDGRCDTGRTILRLGEEEAECTLRAAIEEANFHEDHNVIGFKIPNTDREFDAQNVWYTIAPNLDPLPEVVHPVTIDGRTQQEYTTVDFIDPVHGLGSLKGRPVIQISGHIVSGIVEEISGLVLRGGASTIRGIAINRFLRGDALVLDGPGFNVVNTSYFGTDPTGFWNQSGNENGIRIASSDNLIGGIRADDQHVRAGNIISNNVNAGILIEDTAFRNRILGNLIGSDILGVAQIGNATGVIIRGGSQNVVGQSLATGNVIVGSEKNGVLIEGGDSHAVLGNYIGRVPFRDLIQNSNGEAAVRFNNVKDSEIGDYSVAQNKTFGNVFYSASSPAIEVVDSDGIAIRSNDINGALDGPADNLPVDVPGVLISGTSSEIIVGGSEAYLTDIIDDDEPGEQVFGIVGVAHGNVIYGGIETGENVGPTEVRGNTLSVNHFSPTSLMQPFDIAGNGPSCFAWNSAGGPAREIAPPRILSLSRQVVRGVTSIPNGRVEVFVVDATGEGRGRYFGRTIRSMGQENAQADGQFAIQFLEQLNAGDLVAVAVTDADGNTSEVSQLKRPVIVIPGVGGTWIRDGSDDLWLPDGATAITQNESLARMALDSNGNSPPSISANEIIEETFGTRTLYGPGIDALNTVYPGDPDNANSLEIDMWRFPYDWRLSVARPGGSTAQLMELVERVTGRGQDVAVSCDVDIIAHSNGGIVGSQYLRTNPSHSQNRVRRFISVGTPYLGTPQAAAAHSKGYIFQLESSPLYGWIFANGFFVDWGAMIAMARNMPAAYTLLPGHGYWSALQNTGITHYLEDLNGNPLLSHQQTFDFLGSSKFDSQGTARGLDRNALMWLGELTSVHDVINDWRTYDGPPQIFRYVGSIPNSTAEGWRYGGSGVPLLPDFYNPIYCEGIVNGRPQDGSDHCRWRRYQLPVLGDGDGTVTLRSSTLGRFPGFPNPGVDLSGVDASPWIEEFRRFPCEHLALVEPGCVNRSGTDLFVDIANTLSGGWTIPAPAAGKTTGTNTLVETPGNDIYFIVSNSPISVDIKDGPGNHIGPEPADSLNQMVYEIPAIHYYPGDHAVTFSAPVDQNFSVVVRAAGDSALVRVTRVFADTTGSNTQVLFPVQPLASDGTISWSLLAGGAPLETALKVDADGNGSQESNLSPGATLDGTTVEPATPRPFPGNVAASAFTNDTQSRQSLISFSNSGALSWTWSASVQAAWLGIQNAAGQTTEPIELNFDASNLGVGVYRDTVSVTVSIQNLTLLYRIPVKLEVFGLRTLTEIDVEPVSVSIRPGESQQFTATGRDQVSDPIVFSPNWTAAGGTIDNNGRFTAGETHGVFTVTASGDNGAVQGIATIVISDISSVGIESGFDSTIPTAFNLYPGYPNPFNPSVTIPFDVKDAVHVSLKVYDLLGKEVATLLDGEVAPGRYESKFDAHNLSTGVYIFRIVMGDFTMARKVVLLK